ncbi:MAG TPA: hypothetical protein VFK85_03875 [Anaeromyxobacteraceae bacterium]|nr:hypothetical protein [Anaeromyxobacteraceae bacterium]
MTLANRAPLALLCLGAASLAYGSIATMPRTADAQIVATVFVGAALVFLGALRLATLLAWSPVRADALLEAMLPRRRVARLAPALFERTRFAEVPVLRWGLCVALLAVAAFAAAVLASDVFAWMKLAWAVPRGAPRIVLG